MSCAPTVSVSGCGAHLQTWAGYGLPDASVEGYGGATDPGLVRTQYDDGSVRQRRRWPSAPRRTVQVAWTLDGATLQTAEAWLDAYGYDWHTQRLTTGATAPAAATTVRLIADYQVAAIDTGIYRITASIEVQP